MIKAHYLILFLSLVLIGGVAPVTKVAGSNSGFQYTPATAEWNQPVKAFRIVGNIYYVGASEVSSFLITTPKGHILLDSGFAETVPLIEDGFKQLGFKIKDVKILINSHAHYDHAGGLALLKELTGARLMTSEADAELMANGGTGDFTWGDKFSYRPVKADRILVDKDTIELGGVTMTVRLTPGHTKGSTTWTMTVAEDGKKYNVVFVSSTSAPGYKLKNNLKYPQIVSDYGATFRLLKTLPCDVFLGPHGSFFALEDKRKRLANGEKGNPFIDPKEFQQAIEQSERNFEKQLKEENPDLSPSFPYTNSICTGLGIIPAS